MCPSATPPNGWSQRPFWDRRRAPMMANATFRVGALLPGAYLATYVMNIHGTTQSEHASPADAFGSVRRPLSGYVQRKWRVEPSLTDDVVQEALARAWAARHRFDSRRPLEPWLRSIADRIMIDHFRRLAAEARAHSRVLVDAPRTTSPADASPEGADLPLSAVSKYLNAREFRYVSRRASGWKSHAIALDEGVSEAAVRSVLVRAEHKLRRLWGCRAAARVVS